MNPTYFLYDGQDLHRIGAKKCAMLYRGDEAVTDLARRLVWVITAHINGEITIDNLSPIVLDEHGRIRQDIHMAFLNSKMDGKPFKESLKDSTLKSDVQAFRWQESVDAPPDTVLLKGKLADLLGHREIKPSAMTYTSIVH